MLHPHGRKGVNGSRPGYVAIDLAVLPGDLPTGWQVQAKTRITLVNHRDPALSKVFQGGRARVGLLSFLPTLVVCMAIGCQPLHEPAAPHHHHQ